MNPTIKASFKNTISSLEAKSREASEADFNVTMISEQAKNAQNRISTKQNLLNTLEASFSNIQQQINSPPMIEKSSGNKNSKTKMVVDEQALTQLKTESNNLSSRIATAKNEVGSAREQAETASTEALSAAGIRDNVITQANELEARVRNMQSQVSQRNNVSDQDLGKLSEDINEFIRGLNANDNKGNVLSNAVYKPLAAGLENIMKTIERNNAETDPNKPPQEGTIYRQLFDIGIKGNSQSPILNLMERAAQRDIQIDGGQSFTKDQMRTMYNEYKNLTGNLTDTQKNSSVIKDFKTDMDSLVTKSGHGDILTEGGG